MASIDCEIGGVVLYKMVVLDFCYALGLVNINKIRWVLRTDRCQSLYTLAFTLLLLRRKIVDPCLIMTWTARIHLQEITVLHASDTGLQEADQFPKTTVFIGNARKVTIIDI